MTKVLAVIPARGGSKGVPGKNIRPVQGLPLIGWTIREALKSSRITELVCSTDSPEIAAVCEQCGLSVPELRPPELGADDTRTQDVILDLLTRTEGSYDYLLLLQPTAPLRVVEDIDAAIALAEAHQANSVVSFCEAHSHHPYYMYQYSEGDPAQVRQLMEYEMGTPRQEFPRMIYRNGAIYLVKLSWFLSAKSFVSDDVIPYLMPEERSVNLDAEEDFDFLEWKLSRNLSG